MQEKIEEHREISKNREYEGNLPKINFQINFSCPRETWEIQPLRLSTIGKGAEIKCKNEKKKITS